MTNASDFIIPPSDDPVWETLEAQCELALNEVRDLYALDATRPAPSKLPWTACSTNISVPVTAPGSSNGW